MILPAILGAVKLGSLSLYQVHSLRKHQDLYWISHTKGRTQIEGV